LFTYVEKNKKEKWEKYWNIAKLVLLSLYSDFKIVVMTHNVIKEQVKTIEKATNNASKSKESALKFLKTPE
jgi:hypothetical protein